MTKTILQFLMLFILLTAAQVLVFNHLCLFDVAIPLAFIYFVMRLPVTLSAIGVLTLSFLTGLTVDIFSDTAGMNALACTILGGIRKPVLKLYFPREEDLTIPEPSMRSLGVGTFMKYNISISLIYCMMFFSIEAFTFFNPAKLIMRIVASTLLTFIIIMCIDNLMDRRSEKRL